jgi:hypothetical protein
MNVAELIAFLRTLPQDAPVAFRRFSEQCLVEPKDVELLEACLPRPDGWIQDKRPDMPKQTYVVFPGN